MRSGAACISTSVCIIIRCSSPCLLQIQKSASDIIDIVRMSQNALAEMLTKSLVYVLDIIMPAGCYRLIVKELVPCLRGSSIPSQVRIRGLCLNRIFMRAEFGRAHFAQSISRRVLSPWRDATIVEIPMTALLVDEEMTTSRNSGVHIGMAVK